MSPIWVLRPSPSRSGMPSASAASLCGQFSSNRPTSSFERGVYQFAILFYTIITWFSSIASVASIYSFNNIWFMKFKFTFFSIFSFSQLCSVFNSKERNSIIKHICLRIKLFRTCSHFFGYCSILLNNLIKLLDCRINLV